MIARISPFLMFDGRAEEAMEFYVALFPDATVKSVRRYESGEAEGRVMHAMFTVCGLALMCMDSPQFNEFGFTPASSLFVECDDEAEIARLFAALGEGGDVLMPLDTYPFSRRFGWLNDRFGVSWQLNLTEA